MGYRLQWKIDQITTMPIHKYAFEHVVCKTTAILSRPPWVDSLACWHMYASVYASSDKITIDLHNDFSFAKPLFKTFLAYPYHNTHQKFS